MLPTLPPLSRRVRLWLFAATALAVGCLGASIGIALWGSEAATLGPVEVRLDAGIGGGRTQIELPPFGRISANTHRGPITLSLSPTSVDLERLSDELQSGSVSEVTDRIASDARERLPWFGVRLVAVAAAGAFALALLAFRSRLRWVVMSVTSSLVMVGSSLALSGLTFDLDAFEEPTFSGSLSAAPGLIGPARQVASTIEDFRLELRRVVSGAVRAYRQIEPGALSADEEIRVLHVSDMHLSPIGMDFTRELARGFDVDLVIDTGDLTSYGTPFEMSIIQEVGEIGRPYLFVRGNHDSEEVASTLDALPNAASLDGRVIDAAGLTVYGRAHPVFTEDANEEIDHGSFVERARAEGRAITRDLLSLAVPPDIVAVHDERMAETLAGRVPLVLSGHFHVPAARREGRTVFLRSGSTGGAGVNVFERSEGMPLSALVLHFDRAEPNRLLAYDEITQEPVTANLLIERHLVRS